LPFSQAEEILTFVKKTTGAELGGDCTEFDSVLMRILKNLQHNRRSKVASWLKLAHDNAYTTDDVDIMYGEWDRKIRRILLYEQQTVTAD
jgi:hypothetical protein